MKILLSSVIIALPLFSCASESSKYSAYRASEDYVPYTGNLNLDCQISSAYYSYALSLDKATYDNGDSQLQKPHFTMVSNTIGHADLKTRFTIHTLSNGIDYQTFTPFYITSPGDPYSRIDCRNGDMEKGELWFFKEKESEPTANNYCQQFYIEWNNSDSLAKYRFFMVNNNTRYYLTFNSSLEVKLLKQSSISDYKYATFNILSLAGDVSLTSHLEIVSAGGYNFDFDNTTQAYRTYASRRSNMDYALFGNPFSFGVNLKEEYTPELLGGQKYFKLPYNFAGFEFVYDFTFTSLWKADSSLIWADGLQLQAQDTFNDRGHIQAATNDINDCILGKSIGTGMIGIMRRQYQDNYWNYLEGTTFNYIDRSYHGVISFDFKKHVSTEIQEYRMFFAYRVNDGNKSKDIFLFSDSFYLSIYGQSYTDEFLPYTVTPLEEITNEDETGYSISPNGSLPTSVLKGSLLLNGFTVTPYIRGYQATVSRYAYDDTYPIENIVYDRGVTYASGATDFTESGRFRISLKDVNNDSTPNEGNIYVAGGDFKSFFFGKIFSNTENERRYDNPIFVSGNRIISGQAPSEISQYGIYFPYPNYQYPTYNGPVTLKTKPTLDYAKNIKITVERYDEYGELASSDSYFNNYFITEKALNDVGTYHITIETTFNETCGYNPTFEISFHIVKDNQKPFLNNALLNAYLDIPDYIPDYYTYTAKTILANYKDNTTGQEVIKTISRDLRYIFHSYDDALSYGLGNEKSKVTYLSDGRYLYNGNQYDDEYSLFSALYRNTKRLIQKGYMDYSRSGLKRIKDLYWTMNDSGNATRVDGAPFVNYYDVPDFFLAILESALPKATDKQFANGFKFTKDSAGIVSDHIKVNRMTLNDKGEIINRTLVIENYDYSKTIGESLSEINAPSGTYEFVEYNVHGYSTSYLKDYLVSNTACSAVITFTTPSGSLLTLSATYDSENLSIALPKGSFISSVHNEYDHYSLAIIVTPFGETIITNTREFTSLMLNKVGNYMVFVRDRMNNSYSALVEVS